MNPDIDASLAAPRPAGSWSDRQIARLSSWIVGQPLLSMLFGLLLVMAGAGGLGGYHYSLDHRVFFSAENPQLQAFEKLHQDYAKTDAVIIALAPQAGSVFSPEFLGVLRELTEKSWQLPYSQRVESLTNFQHVRVAGDSIDSADLVANPASLDGAALAEIRPADVARCIFSLAAWLWPSPFWSMPWSTPKALSPGCG